MNINDFVTILKDQEIDFEKNQKRAQEIRKENEEKLKKTQEDFVNKLEDFKSKVYKGLISTAENSNGAFTFRELPEHVVYYNDEQAENERIRKEFKHTFDEKVELLFDFNISTGKNNNNFDITLNFFNLENNFSILYQLSNYNKMIEELYSFDDYIAQDFENNLAQMLKKLNEK